MTNISLITMGLYIDIKFPLKKLSKYKTKKGLENFVHRTIFDFLDKLKSFNGVDLCLIKRINYDNELHEVNDLNYSCNNIIEKDYENTTYRIFDYEILGIANNNIKTSFVSDSRYKIEDITISLNSCSFGKYNNKNL